MRIKIIKNQGSYKAGDVIDVSRNVAFGLIDSGVGALTKDMTPDDYQQAGDKDGSTTQLRTHNISRR